MGKDQLKEQVIEAIKTTPHKDAIKSISLFGSFLHGDNNEDSDVDLLVELDRQKPVGFFKFVGIQQHLEEKLGRKVDLVTRDSLSRFIRDKVIKEAEKIYG
ncbi:MAG: DNA polymerase beta domain-containing protein region [Candidatus Berkelbacteria bacterium Gr01-1014_85]|uniref:DNA polymerase beta domain-containing protein region n=1 Tax=Candidatus Berkelbacteria bacterium Gr01-1014_85 TaxID=2017150 RepID=A0A554JE60_9BACT|nr:MAG: DNA polymerase beta domain-containing protein region [Candidatus Berkelbacteria bacterium Gr01-1014_85]